MPNSLNVIDDLAFWSCTLLNNAPIPNGVTRIGLSAFSQCFSLPSVTIPQSVTDVGDAAFKVITASGQVLPSPYRRRSGGCIDRKPKRGRRFRSAPALHTPKCARSLWSGGDDS